jgi:hypothetical protein
MAARAASAGVELRICIFRHARVDERSGLAVVGGRGVAAVSIAVGIRLLRLCIVSAPKPDR